MLESPLYSTFYTYGHSPYMDDRLNIAKQLTNALFYVMQRRLDTTTSRVIL